MKAKEREDRASPAKEKRASVSLSTAGLIQLIRWRLETVKPRACACRCLRVFGAVPWIGGRSLITYVARVCPVLLCNQSCEAYRSKGSLELR